MERSVKYSNIQADLIQAMRDAIGSGDVGNKALEIALDALREGYKAGAEVVTAEVRKGIEDNWRIGF
jgi:hypothetical protein